VLNEYRKHPGLIARIIGYRVQLGFGLHIGWAIEGAIGSQYKIDASYLSPHVQRTTLMEYTTKIYGVPIALSNDLVNFMDADLMDLLRPVDNVFLPGSKTPVEVFVMDLDIDTVTMVPYVATGSGAKERFKIRQIRNVAKDSFWKESFSAVSLFSTDHTLKLMRAKYTKKFFQAFQKGYLNYRAGEWEVALEALKESSNMLGTADGPSTALIDFIKSQPKGCPAGWKGIRSIQLT
jgi:hypothetical protein